MASGAVTVGFTEVEGRSPARRRGFFISFLDTGVILTDGKLLSEG